MNFLNTALLANLPWINSICAFLLIKEHIIEIKVGKGKFFTKIRPKLKKTGKSMIPTFGNNEIIVIDHLTPKFTGYSIDDIVLATNPYEQDSLISKRVIQTPANTVLSSLTGETIIVPVDHFWLEGDNKDFSLDSRHLGPVSAYHLKGRVIATLYPNPKLLL
jgi:hypothetical protein